MHLLSSIVFAITVNIDNFAVGIAYGIKRIKIGILGNLIIAAISGLGTFFSMYLGFYISKIINLSVTNLLGSIIIIGIGLYFILDFFLKYYKKSNHFISIELLENPEKADTDSSGHIDNKEALTLAFALSLNNLGLGMGSSISGVNIISTTLFTFLFSIPAIIIGYRFGNSFLSSLFGKYTSLISGLIIIFLGIYELFI